MAASRPPFVGRERELHSLLSSLHQAAQRGGAVALVGGEPGIGKTRLVSELAVLASADGWLVLTCRADESEAMLPYLPFVEALRSYCRTGWLDELREQLGEGAAEVAILVPEARHRLPELEASRIILRPL